MYEMPLYRISKIEKTMFDGFDIISFPKGYKKRKKIVSHYRINATLVLDTEELKSFQFDYKAILDNGVKEFTSDLFDYFEKEVFNETPVYKFYKTPKYNKVGENEYNVEVSIIKTTFSQFNSISACGVEYTKLDTDINNVITFLTISKEDDILYDVKNDIECSVEQMRLSNDIKDVIFYLEAL